MCAKCRIYVVKRIGQSGYKEESVSMLASDLGEDGGGGWGVSLNRYVLTFIQGPRWLSGNTHWPPTSEVGGSNPGPCVRKVGSCLTIVSSLQYRTLTN